MRILILDTEPIRRGAQVFISELSYFIAKTGHEVKVVYLYSASLDKPNSSLQAMNDENLYGNKSEFLHRLVGVNPKLVSRLVTALDIFNPEIVLCNGSGTLKYAALARQLYHKPTIWIARWIDDAAYWNPGKTSKWIYVNMIMTQFDACVGVSQASLTSIIRHYNFKKPTRVIHRAFDPKKFKNAPDRAHARKELGISEDQEVLLFLGNLTAQKRPDRFVKIFQKLAETRPNLNALIVGDGPLREELEVSSKKYRESRAGNQKPAFVVPAPDTSHPASDTRHPTSNIQHPTSDIGHPTKPNISFTGYQQDVSTCLAAADILVLTSDTEGLPGVVLEAAYFAVPTVATAVGGIRECLLDGISGLLVPDRSIEQFNKKISLLLANPELKHEMGRAARSLVAERFKMEKITQDYLDFFGELIYKKG